MQIAEESSVAEKGEIRFRTPLSAAPAFLLLLYFVSFIALSASFGYPGTLAFRISSLLVLGWTMVGTRTANRSFLPVAAWLCLAAVCGCGYFNVFFSRADGVSLPHHVRAEGAVLTIRPWGSREMAVVDSPQGRYVLRFVSKPLREGDIVRFAGRTRGFRRAEGAREFDELRFWRAKGARAYIEDADIEVTGKSLGAARWRAAMNDRIEATLPRRTAGYLAAILTGKRSSALNSLHRAVGTSHLLAVSGFHVALVWGIVWFFFRRMRFRFLLVSVSIWLYVLLAGAAPSALRAAFMIQLAIAGRILGRVGNGFNTTSAAGVLLLLWNPWLFWDIGWRLSMLAVLCITAVSALSIGAQKKYLVAGPAVWLATSAQATWSFGKVPVAGVFVNFLALPVFAVLFQGALLLSLPALLGLPGARFFNMVVEFCFARWEQFSLNVLYLCPWDLAFSWPVLAIAVFVLTAFFACANGFGRHRALAMACLAAIALWALRTLV